ALEDAQASVSEPSEVAEMAVRRGGRGRRRGGGKTKPKEQHDEVSNGDEPVSVADEHESEAPDAPEVEAPEESAADEKSNGDSRKIESANERSRLRQMLQRIREDKNIPSGGFIVRTAGIGISEEDLRNDAVFLARSWADNKKASEKKKSPAMIHQDLDLVQR